MKAVIGLEDDFPVSFFGEHCELLNWFGVLEVLGQVPFHHLVFVKDYFLRFYHGQSPLNHHFGNMLCFFPTAKQANRV